MYKIYKIEAGDTFESVAKKFNTTVDMLKRINGMNENDNILVSQYLIVPVERGVLFDIYVVQPGDNMYQIAKRYGVKEEELLKLNGLEKNQYIYQSFYTNYLLELSLLKYTISFEFEHFLF